jgi:hypothetical protein
MKAIINAGARKIYDALFKRRSPVRIMDSTMPAMPEITFDHNLTATDFEALHRHERMIAERKFEQVEFTDRELDAARKALTRALDRIDSYENLLAERDVALATKSRALDLAKDAIFSVMDAQLFRKLPSDVKLKLHAALELIYAIAE